MNDFAGVKSKKNANQDIICNDQIINTHKESFSDDPSKDSINLPFEPPRSLWGLFKAGRVLIRLPFLSNFLCFHLRTKAISISEIFDSSSLGSCAFDESSGKRTKLTKFSLKCI
jgi:hypothetical protein